MVVAVHSYIAYVHVTCNIYIVWLVCIFRSWRPGEGLARCHFFRATKDPSTLEKNPCSRGGYLQVSSSFNFIETSKLMYLLWTPYSKVICGYSLATLSSPFLGNKLTNSVKFVNATSPQITTVLHWPLATDGHYTVQSLVHTPCECKANCDIMWLCSQQTFCISWTVNCCKLFVVNLWCQSLYRICICRKYEQA